MKNNGLRNEWEYYWITFLLRHTLYWEAKFYNHRELKGIKPGGVVRYTGLILAPAEDFKQELAYPFGQKRGFVMHFVAY